VVLYAPKGLWRMTSSATVSRGSSVGAWWHDLGPIQRQFRGNATVQQSPGEWTTPGGCCKTATLN